MITTIEDAISFLRGLDKIYIPNDYTYFHHNTYYQTEYDKENTTYSRAWVSIPVEDFYVSNSLSCVEMNDRISEALHYGGREKASIAYAHPKECKTFAIRIIMPKNRLSDDQYSMMGLSPEEIQMLKREYAGLGDMRHPKLANKEHIIIIGSTTKDEVSGKDLDIVYGVREQDIIYYANEVARQNNIALALDNDYLDRFKDKGLTSNDPDKALVVLSDFEQDYYKEKGGR